MSSLEAAATADGAEAGSRTKSISPRTIPVVGVVTPHEDVQVPPGRSGEGLRDSRVEARAGVTQTRGSGAGPRGAVWLAARGAGCRQPTCLGTLAAWSARRD